MTSLITDPDNLNDATEIVITVSTKKIQLVQTGNLGPEGVTIKCVYSKLKELWKSNTTYIKYAFPMGPITDEQFEMINDWDWTNDTTRYLLRTGGWALKDSGGTSQEEWAGIVTLGSIGSGDQAYCLQSGGGSTVNFQLTGPVNQAIKVYGDSSHGNFDYRSYMKIYCRIYQKSYGFSQLSDIGVSTLTYQAYRFPLANATDVKITHDDTAVSTTTPYTGMSLTWYAAAQGRDIGGTTRYFHVIVGGNSGTAEQIYEFIQYKLRQATDIDEGSGSQIGKVTGALLKFVGDTLYTQAVTEGGTFIDSYQSADINRLVFVDDSSIERTFPYTAVLTMNFGDNLKNDTDARYWVYFTNDDAGTNSGYDYGTSNAILVNTTNSFATTYRARASNVATITTATAHGLTIGDGVDISGLGGTGYNGDYIVVSVPDTTHFTYTNTGDNESETADTGGTIIWNMTEKIGGVSSKQLSFAYDTNVQRGAGSDGDEAPVTCVAIGLATGQFVKATGTITRSIANSVSLVAPLERNYANP